MRFFYLLHHGETLARDTYSPASYLRFSRIHPGEDFMARIDSQSDGSVGLVI